MTDLLRILTNRDGFFTRREALAAGYDDRAIAYQVRARVWTRFRRGFYAFADEWAALDDVGRHRVRSRAVCRSLGDGVVLSHVSAAIAHGVDVWGVPLDRVHVTRLDGGAGRIEGDVVHHQGVCPDRDIVEIDGLRVTNPVRSVLETGSRTTSEAALCLFDNGLHRGLFKPHELLEAHRQLGDWPWMRHLHVPVQMADGRSASVGESRGRWLFWTFQLPAPDLQVEVHDAGGELLGICDWGWRDPGLYGEFDGRLKYGRALRAGQDPSEVVFAEKRREDLIREASSCAMVRLIWSDYDRPAQTAARIERLLRRAS